MDSSLPKLVIPLHGKIRAMSNRKARAQKRRHHYQDWPLRKFALGQEPMVDQRDNRRSAKERIEAVWALSLQHWQLSGRPLPTYSRAEIPGRLIKKEPSNSLSPKAKHP